MAIGEAAATAVALNVVNRISNAMLDRVALTLGQKAIDLRARFLKNFQTHLGKSLQKSKVVKTVVSKDKPVNLETIYVPLMLDHDDEKALEGDGLDPTVAQGRRIIVSGTGGAGKTILMKHLLNVAVANRNGIVPLFFDLRSLKSDTFEDILHAVHFELVREGGDESIELLEACLIEGVVAIFLDGFDEVHPDRMAQTLKAIEIFGRRFTLTSMIISTRPGTGLQNLVDFEVYHLRPLTKSQAIEVVNKTKFDLVSKTNFVRALEGGLYEKHETMMSIPILVVMMLLTYRSYGDIPDRMTVFYGQAFDTLFAIHDNESKTQYKRVYLSGLAPDQFKQVLESFCYRSLAQHELEFTQDALERYVSESIKFEKVNTTSENFRSDLVKNVCLLQPDGVNYVFVHRSFQEYFAARFALRYSGSNQFKVIDKIVQGRGGGVARMMDEMNKPKFYREWLLPTLVNFRSELRSLKSLPPWEGLGAFFGEVSFKAGKFASASAGRRYPWDGGLEVARSVSNANVGLISILSDLRLSCPIDDAQLETDPLWGAFVQFEPQGPDEAPEMVISIQMTEKSSNVFRFLNIPDALEKYEMRVESEIDRVTRFVDEQIELECELLS